MITFAQVAEKRISNYCNKKQKHFSSGVMQSFVANLTSQRLRCGLPALLMSKDLEHFVEALLPEMRDSIPKLDIRNEIATTVIISNVIADTLEKTTELRLCEPVRPKAELTKNLLLLARLVPTVDDGTQAMLLGAAGQKGYSSKSTTIAILSTWIVESKDTERVDLFFEMLHEIDVQAKEAKKVEPAISGPRDLGVACQFEMRSPMGSKRGEYSTRCCQTPALYLETMLDQSPIKLCQRHNTRFSKQPEKQNQQAVRDAKKAAPQGNGSAQGMQPSHPTVLPFPGVGQPSLSPAAQPGTQASPICAWDGCKGKAAHIINIDNGKTVVVCEGHKEMHTRLQFRAAGTKAEKTESEAVGPNVSPAVAPKTGPCGWITATGELCDQAATHVNSRTGMPRCYAHSPMRHAEEDGPRFNQSDAAKQAQCSAVSDSVNPVRCTQAASVGTGGRCNFHFTHSMGAPPSQWKSCQMMSAGVCNLMTSLVGDDGTPLCSKHLQTHGDFLIAETRCRFEVSGVKNNFCNEEATRKSLLNGSALCQRHFCSEQMQAKKQAREAAGNSSSSDESE